MRLFGTDGIRGTANTEPMTAKTALEVAMAVAARFRRGSHRHRVLIGKDTRLSGYLIEPAMTAGFIAMGMDVILLGPMPTPAVAMLTRSLRADIGVMISASHNPFEDNGIKLFGPDGYKLSDETERQIEDAVGAGASLEPAAPSDLGRASRLEGALGRYVEYAKNTFPRGMRLDGLKIVLDCAHGAAYKVAPTALWELGAEVVKLGVDPDGININAGCGATATEAMQAAVAEHGADLGIALDGDADRLILADEAGRRIDGDQLMGVIARDWQRTERLRGGGMAATVMSNLGLERFLGGLGLALHRTPVGDRYVVEAMRECGLNLGGEQSGHIVMSDYATTGDGLIAALQVLAVIREAERPASEVARVFQPVPQKLRNVRFLTVAGRPSPLDSPKVVRAIDAAEARLNGAGRILIRKSGTEPVIRVMAEGDDETLIESLVAEICGAIEISAAA
jgi:phosphoglucosamine mutase